MRKTTPTPSPGACRVAKAASLAAALAVCLVAAPAGAKKKAPKIIPAIPDGSRTPPVHLIQLFDHDGELIDVADDPEAPPLSTQVTCNKCHEYENISRGWHFNSAEAKIDPGRRGEPWILTDRRTGTQIPLSNRKWQGTFRPAQLKISNWRMTQIFGRQMPGGGVGEMESQEDILRSFQSGPLEINCMGCHSRHGDQDQTAWAVNVGSYNYKWAATAASGLARVSGDISTFPAEAEEVTMRDPDHREYKHMQVAYHAARFDADNKVFLDVVRSAGAQRCYFCHSTRWTGPDAPEYWRTDRDVHLAAGLTCTDCHRNGEFHHIVRGFEGEKSPSGASATLTCRGCHLGGDTDRAQQLPGRLGAPYPQHEGLPTVHLDKLSCTACHSGPWPGARAGRVETSRSHGLGIHGQHTADPVLPYIASPVFMKGHDGKIAPHHAMWPAYWGRIKDGKITPIPVADVAEAAGDILPETPPGPKSKKYKPLTDEQISAALAKLAGDEKAPPPVYVAAGMVYRIGADGKLSSSAHEAAKPYAWPFAHAVRPAGKSLGALDRSGCSDCHSTESAIFFGEVAAEAPAKLGQTPVKKMYELLEEDGTHWRLFAMSFVFRPMLKIVAFAAAAVIAAVLLVYGLGALRAVAARFSAWSDKS